MRERGRNPRGNPGDPRVTGRLDTASCSVSLILPMTGGASGRAQPNDPRPEDRADRGPKLLFIYSQEHLNAWIFHPVHVNIAMLGQLKQFNARTQHKAAQDGPNRMPSRRQKRRDVARVPPFGEMHLVVTNGEQDRIRVATCARCSTKSPNSRGAPTPPFSMKQYQCSFVARNKNGFWIARDVEGRNGGIFLLKRSALCFARKNSEPAGCATMLLNEPHELDVKNQGGRFVIVVSVAMDAVVHFATSVVALISITREVCQKLIAYISHVVAGRTTYGATIKKGVFGDSTFLYHRR